MKNSVKEIKNTSNRIRRRVKYSNLTMSVLTATILVYAIGAGITAAAGTRLSLQWNSLRCLDCTHSNQLNCIKLVVVISCHNVYVSGLGNLRGFCLP